ncbi:nucleoside triphosphate pyrophosphohydrolase [Treponema sp.]|uniref:nucleoside triphosphate pyrophosphohydrolase n=1 Tax=Treponema sp. TaxID=166 RepID=UPI00298E595B|nr:nucleoside triphosphate pyrophosphohydrolase [Treponema sp.]
MSMPDFDKVLKGDFNTAEKAYNRLYNVVSILRSENGCPWDREQTPMSMRRDLIEETFETVDAITQNDSEHAKEELGDVLLNATMISYMYEQKGDFTLAQVLNELSEKLIRRHPHVFPESEGRVCEQGDVKNGEQVLSQWDRIKENVEGRKTECILDEVPDGFPPLLKAFKYQKKAAKKGFDWDNIDDVKAKVREEFEEAENARLERDSAASKQNAKVFERNSTKEADDAQKHLEEEIGDFFFALVNYARKLGVDPETALNRANRKFYRRFSYVQRKMQETGQEMADGALSIMDKFWDEAKEKGL